MDRDVEQFKRRVDEARAALGIARKDLARRIGAAPSTVSEWYTQDKMPAANHVIRLPEALGVSAEWLLTGTGPRERTIPNGADPFAAGQRNVLERLVEELSRELAKLNAEKASRGEVEDSSDG